MAEDISNLRLVQQAENLQRVTLPYDYKFELGVAPSNQQLLEMTKHCDEVGVAHANEQLFNGDIVIDTPKMLKINLPFLEDEFQNGRGEGVWVYPFTSEDNAIYKANEIGSVFKCILLNDSEYYPFIFGTIFEAVIIDKLKRPIMRKKWLSDSIDRSDAPFTLEDVLKGKIYE